MENDLISRSALLEAIAAAFFKTEPTGEEQLGYLACNRIVREFPGIDAEPVRLDEAAQPKWISVEDELPEVSDVVLVIASGKPRANVELHNAMLIASYWGDEGWIADGFEGWDKLDVTHWMQLPEPPKEGT